MISYSYKNKDTVIHRLNPFCKLAWIASIFILALLFNHPIYLLLLFLSTLPLVIAAKIWKEWVSFMKFAIFICILVVLMNTLMNTLVSQHGSHVLLEIPFTLPVLGTPQITLESILYGVGMSLRLLAIISAFTILTFAIHPDDLMLAMIKLKLPYKSVLLTSLSTKFVPALFEDVTRISDGQRSRGLELDKGNFIQRIKARSSVIIPLLSNSLDRSIQIAEAMESRAFGSGSKRTFYKGIKMSRFDVLLLLAAVSPCAFGIYLRITGEGEYDYYPTIQGVNLSMSEYSMLLLFVFLLLLMLLFTFLRRVELD